MNVTIIWLLEELAGQIRQMCSGLGVADDNVCRGWRDVLLEEGPEAWAKKIRAHKELLITDTTWWAANCYSMLPNWDVS